MNLFTRSRRVGLAVAALLVLSLLAAAVAVGVHFGGHTTDSGSAQKKTVVQRSSSPAATSSTAFASLHGTQTQVAVPAGQTDLVVARWVGETHTGSQCIGRITAVSAAGIFELHPIDPLQFFDTSGDGPETHSIERSRRLGPGTYLVIFQYRVPSGTCFVDDWHFMVEMHD